MQTLADYLTIQSFQDQMADILGLSAEGIQELVRILSDEDTATGILRVLSEKVDKVTGKGLSTNDYTTEEKNKLAGIAAGAEANVNADWNATSGDAVILNKPAIPDVSDVRSTLYGGDNSGYIDLTSITAEKAFISGGTWFSNNTYYLGKFIECVPGDKYIFSNQSGSNPAYYTFLKSIDNATQSGTVPDYATGYGSPNANVTAGVVTGEITAPDDANYIWISVQNGANKPDEMTSITHIETVAGLTEKVDGLSDKVEKLDTNIISPIKTFSRNNLPVVSFIFDDIHDNDEQIVDLFDSYGLTCGFAFVATDSKIAAYKEKYIAWQRRGYSILNHSIDSNPINTTTCQTIADAYSVVTTAKSKLEKAGFIVNGWVSPNSTFPTAYIDVLKNLQSYAYIDSSSNTRYTHPCMLSRLSLQTTLLSDILDTNSNNQSSIAFYVAVNRQLTFYGHAAELGNTPTGGEEFSIAKIRSVIEKCIELRDEGKLLILSPDDMFRYFFGSLPASTIWTGTQAAYDNLSSDLKSRIIAFITE